MRSLICFTAVMLVGALSLHAQSPPSDLSNLPITSEPLVDGNLLNRAPRLSSWTITSKIVAPALAGAQPGPVSKPSQSIVTKSDDLYMVESLDHDGKKIVRWKRNQLQATYLPGAVNPEIAYSPGALYYLDFSQSDFPELYWISAQDYLGTTKMGAGKVLVFKANVDVGAAKMPMLSIPHPSPSTVVALVDPETRKPIMLQVDDEVIVYQFAPSPPPALALPKELQASFDFLIKRIQRASVLPPG